MLTIRACCIAIGIVAAVAGLSASAASLHDIKAPMRPVSVKASGACSGLSDQACFNASSQCIWCPQGYAGGQCQAIGTQCNCSAAGALANMCMGIPGCKVCPEGYQGASCVPASATCPCQPMMEHSCIAPNFNSQCKWCPAGSGGGVCVNSGTPCTCDTFSQNTCLSHSQHCHWCGQGAMGGLCRNVSTQCNCAVMVMNECTFAAGCKFCPSGPGGQGSCVPSSSSQC
jgi:hypothetical protein